MTDTGESTVDSAGGRHGAEFPHLNLQRWPFDIVPSSEGVENWVGRPTIGKRLRRLVEGAVRVPASRIILLWATFGSGKTHALRHVEYLARRNGSPVAAYIVIPRGIRTFLDIFKAIIDALVAQHVLEDAGRELLRAHGSAVTTDVERGLVRLAVGSPEERRIAAAWLRGDKLPVRDLRGLGLTRPIGTVTDAVHALDDVISVIHAYKGPLVLLVDEVQELEELGRRLSECVGGLHKLFDMNARGLTLVFSFTTGSRASVRSILGQALYDRAAEVIALPPLTVDEAVAFISGVISVWSVNKELVPAPFTSEAIAVVVRHLDDNGILLTPRALLKTFDRVLREGEYEIASADLEYIDETYALEAMASLHADDLS